MKSRTTEIMDDKRLCSSPDRFVCPLCEKGLASGEQLQDHVAEHDGEQSAFRCDVCGKTCPDAGTFGKHLREHTGEKLHKCEQCEKSFREKCSLNRHARKHTGEKPFSCEVCHKRFADAGSHGRHRKTHMGSVAKVHRCPADHCSKSFIDKSSLKRHYKIHTGEKPFVCKVCSKSFTESGSFKRHQRVHSGEKRYRCRSCLRPFSERASMLRHERNVCRVGARKEPQPLSVELDSSQSDCPQPYSLADIYRTIVGKPIDVLNNNNIETPAETEDEDMSHMKVPLLEIAGVEDIIDRDPQQIIQSLCASQSKSTSSHVALEDSTLQEGPQESPELSARLRDNVYEGGQTLEESPCEVPSSRRQMEMMQGGVSDVIRSVAPKMLGLHHLQENWRREDPKEAERGAPNGDVQMCFECGDMMSQDEEEDQSVSDSQSSVSDGNRRRCRTCRQETVSFGNEESLQSAADVAQVSTSPFSGTDGLQVQNLPTKAEQDNQIVEFLSAVLENNRYFEPVKHTCTECGKNFADSSKLKRHMKIHLNIRDFVCKTCGKAFIEAGSLRRHEGVHSDVKPFNCSECGKGFTDSSGLKKHRVKCGAQVGEVGKVGDTEGQVKDTSCAGKEAKVEGARSTERKENGVKCEVDVNGEVTYVAVKYERDRVGLNGKSDMDVSATGKESQQNALCIRSDRGLTAFQNSDPSSPHLVLKNTVLGPKGDRAPALVHDPRSKPYICTKCGIECESESSLLHHSFVHLTGGPGDISLGQAVTCPVCSKRFVSSHYLDKHVAKNHAQISSLPAEVIEAATSLSLLRKYGGSRVFNPKPPAPGDSSQAVSAFDEASKSCRKSAASNLGSDFVKSSAKPSSAIVSMNKDLSSVQEIPETIPTEADWSGSAELPSSQMAPGDPKENSCTEVSSPDGVWGGGRGMCTQFTLPPPSVMFKRSPSLEPACPSNLHPPAASSDTPCEVCGKVFADASSLKRHARLHTDQQQQCVCENCDKVFSDQGSLKRHWLRGCKNISMVTGEGESNVGVLPVTVEVVPGFEDEFACTQCQMIFATREDQMTHEKEHRVAPSLRCTFCRTSFSDAATLQLHLRVHASERPYTCDICLKGFADSGSLGKHRARGCYANSSVVLDASRLHCDHCGKVFSDRLKFNQHVASHRGGTAKLKRYTCEHCGKSFAEACSLKRHTRLHTGQNLCRCLHCGRTFLENSGLKKHLQRRSCLQDKKKEVATAWLFPCTVCDKVFAKRYILLRHSKTHLGLRPFACDKCDKTFTESSSLKRHYRQHTGERPYFCEGCHKTFTDAGVAKKHKQRCADLVDCDEDELGASPSDSPYLFSGSSFGRKFAGHLKGSSLFSPSSRSAPNSAKSGCNTVLIKQHSGRRFRSKECWRCGRHFPSVEAKESHIKARHAGGTRPFPCRLCWRRFLRLPYLRVHHRQQHCISK